MVAMNSNDLTGKVDGAGKQGHAHDEQQQGRALPRAALTQLLLHALAGRAELGVVGVVVRRRVRAWGHAGQSELRVVRPLSVNTESNNDSIRNFPTKRLSYLEAHETRQFFVWGREGNI